MKRGDDKISQDEHLFKFNLQVNYPALFKFIQSLIFFLNTLDQGTTTRYYKQLQCPLTAKNIPIVKTMIIWIHLRQDCQLKKDFVPVIKQVHACKSMIAPEIFYLEFIIIKQSWDDKRCYNITNYHPCFQLFHLSNISNIYWLDICNFWTQNIPLR